MVNIISFIATNNIKSVLDIGANVGKWAHTLKKHLPDIKMLSIEANPNCEKPLRKKRLNYKICCLSNNVKSVKFYMANNTPTGTGCSYYLENTKFFENDKYVELETTTLDILLPDEEFEYIKMDTQGSEIDIINGGISLVKKCKFLHLETSLIEYNIKSPLQKEVFSFLKHIKFEPVSLVEKHYRGADLIQEDFIFKNMNMII